MKAFIESLCEEIFSFVAYAYIGIVCTMNYTIGFIQGCFEAIKFVFRN